MPFITFFQLQMSQFANICLKNKLVYTKFSLCSSHFNNVLCNIVCRADGWKSEKVIVIEKIGFLFLFTLQVNEQTVGEPGWFCGSYHGNRGWFPQSYAEKCPTPSTTNTPVPPSTGKSSCPPPPPLNAR